MTDTKDSNTDSTTSSDSSSTASYNFSGEDREYNRIDSGEAIALFRLLKWEHGHEKEFNNERALDNSLNNNERALDNSLNNNERELDTNKSSSCIEKILDYCGLRTYFYSPERNLSVEKKDLPTLIKENFFCSKQTSHQVNIVNKTVMKIIPRYTKYDNVINPSILLDAIVVGGTTLCMLIEDAKYGAHDEHYYYPIRYSEIAKKCNIHPGYHNIGMIGISSFRTTQIIKELLFKIAYFILIDKSLPFVKVPDDLYSGLNKVYPNNRLDRFNLNAVTNVEQPNSKEFITCYVNTNVNLYNESGFIYELHILKRFVNEGFTEDVIFDDEIDESDKKDSKEDYKEDAKGNV